MKCKGERNGMDEGRQSDGGVKGQMGSVDRVKKRDLCTEESGGEQPTRGRRGCRAQSGDGSTAQSGAESTAQIGAKSTARNVAECTAPSGGKSA